MKPGDVVQVNWRPTFDTNSEPNWTDAVVVDMLSAQFTLRVQVPGEPLTFRFYRGKKDSWRDKP